MNASAPRPRFGNYEVLKRLAVGGMGEIFLARQVGLRGFERMAIVKTMLTEPGGAKEDMINAFLTEARIAALLNHPNIVQVYEVGQEDGIYFIAMEYVPGVTLGAALVASVRTGRHQVWPFVALVVQAARALHHAHTQKDPNGKALQLVHRDISPQNIMVRRDGGVKVLDFGIAKVALDTGMRTKTGVIKGKLAYMAPEQVGSEPLDGRTDLFALGVMLWELTAARRMFTGLTEVQLFARMMKADLPRPSEVVPGYPVDLEAVVMKAVAPDPADRFQDGESMARALEEILRQHPAEWEPLSLPDYVAALVGDQVDAVVSDITPSMPGEARRRESSTPQPRSPAHPPEDEPPTQPVDMADLQASLDAVRGSGRAQPLPPPTPTPARARPAAVAGAALVLLAGVGGATWWATGRAPQAADAARPATAVPPSVPTAVPEAAPGAAAASAGTAPPVGGPPSVAASAVDAGASAVDAGLPLEAADAQRTPPAASRAAVPDRRKADGSRRPGPARAPSERAPAERAPPPAEEPARPSAGPVAESYLTLVTEPWAVVRVDGKPVGSTPLFKLRLTAGKHSVQLTNDTIHVQKTLSVDLAPGSHERMKLDLR